MTDCLSDVTKKIIKNRIDDFHFYLNNGLKLEKAKEIILKSTTIKEVKNYVQNYKLEV